MFSIEAFSTTLISIEYTLKSSTPGVTASISSLDNPVSLPSSFLYFPLKAASASVNNSSNFLILNLVF